MVYSLKGNQMNTEFETQDSDMVEWFREFMKGNLK